MLQMRTLKKRQWVEAYSDSPFLRKAYPQLFEEKTTSVKDGWCTKMFIKGKTSMRPKIPKGGKSHYKGIYKRSSKPFTFLYHIETTIYIAALHDQIDVDDWIDRNLGSIQNKINKLMVWYDMFERILNELRK